jgi:hypothetical protein
MGSRATLVDSAFADCDDDEIDKELSISDNNGFGEEEDSEDIPLYLQLFGEHFQFKH